MKKITIQPVSYTHLILAGIYLAEYGRKSVLAEIIRFINDILLSAPSIVVGLFVYTCLLYTS